MLALASAALSACSIFDSGNDQAPIQGERISVLDLERKLEPDQGTSDTRVRLPRPYVNENWSQSGGTASHAMYHPALPDDLAPAWSIDVGEAAEAERPILAQPVIANGRVFTLDAGSTASAFRVDDGKRLWARDLNTNNERDGVFGGGIAIGENRLYATTGLGHVYALDTETGEIVWEQGVGAPIRSAPTVADGQVYVITVRNETVALNAADGQQLWSHTGIEEQAGLLGFASPAVAESSVVSAYSSGQLFALLADNGRVLWNDNLAGLNRTSQLSDMAHIRGLPVVDRGQVFAASNSGRMVSVNLRSGARTWEAELASAETPWVGGNYIYVITTNARVAALRRNDGRVRWVTQIARYEDPEDREDPITWYGPVLAGDRLILAGSHELAVSISPYTGEVLGSVDLPGAPTVPPVVAGETLYFLTEDATLVAFR